jgi:hypothetical protein
MKTIARLFPLVPTTIVLALFPACGDRQTQARAQPSEAAKVIGVPPAQPLPEPPGVQPVAPGANEMAKPVEVAAMPLPGQADDIENIAILDSQKSEAIDVLKDLELAKLANSDRVLEVWRQKKLRQAQRTQLQREKQARL